MAKKADNTKKKRIPTSESDVFTALLGLAFITLVGTIGYVCWSSMQVFGTYLNTDILF
ncbi:MAG: hypothetical protein K9M57_09290 [Phycisphaerae bacterium]|nr:hypothetical protein [Phycisphaerae bacterium]